MYRVVILFVSSFVLSSEAYAQYSSCNDPNPDPDNPLNIIGNSYMQYIGVRKCYEAREGYQVVYISVPELARAREAVKALEEKALQLNPDIRKDEMWRVANENVDASRNPVIRDTCQYVLKMLMDSYRYHFPAKADGVEKDF
jgi:hypothetical protein